MLYPNLSLKIFERNAKSRMRVCDAVRVHSNSMVRCIEAYKHKCTDFAPEQYGSLIEYLKKTNDWVDVMNNTWEKNCELINSPDHRHVYDLLDYVKYHHRWKQQAGKQKTPLLSSVNV